MFGIIENLKRRHLGKRPYKTRNAACFVNWETARTGILFIAKECVQTEYPACFIEFLQKRLTLEVVYYMPSLKQIPQEQKEREHYLTPQKISYGGKIKDEALRKVLEKDYDLLVDISEKADGIYDYVAGQVDAKCRIGRDRPEGRYDVEFADVKNAKDWIVRLDDLLKTIKTYSI